MYSQLIDYNCLFFPSCYLAGKTERSSFSYGRESNPHCHQVSCNSFLFCSAKLLVTFMCRDVSKPIYLQYTPKSSSQLLDLNSPITAVVHRTEHTLGITTKVQTRSMSIKGLQVKSDVFRWKYLVESPIKIV